MWAEKGGQESVGRSVIRNARREVWAEKYGQGSVGMGVRAGKCGHGSMGRGVWAGECGQSVHCSSERGSTGEARPAHAVASNCVGALTKDGIMSASKHISVNPEPW